MRSRGGKVSTGTMRNFQPELTDETKRVFPQFPGSARTHTSNKRIASEWPSLGRLAKNKANQIFL
jgi:hypothetical protein